MKHKLLIVLLLGPYTLLAQSPPVEQFQNWLLQGRAAKVLQQVQQGIHDIKIKDQPDWLYWEGKAWLMMGDTAKAQQAFEKGIGIAPKYSVYCQVGMGKIYYCREDYETGREFLARAEKLSKKKADPFVEMMMADAFIHGPTADRKKAKITLYRLRDQLPNDPSVEWVLVRYYREQRYWSLIEESARRLIDLQGSSPAYVLLTEALIEQEQFDEAGYYVNEVLTLDPECADAYRWRGELWLRAADYEKALYDYRKYVYYTHEVQKARLRYAGILLLAQKYKTCLHELSQLDSTTQNASRLYHRLQAYAHTELGQFPEARESFSNYQEATPKAEWFIAHDFAYEARMLAAEGHFEQANQQMQIALDRKSLQKHQGIDLLLAYKKLARQSRKQKQYDWASYFLQKYVDEQAHPLMDDLFRLAKDYYFADQGQQSVELLQQYLQQNPVSVEAQYWLGISAIKTAATENQKIWHQAFSETIRLLELEEELDEKSEVYMVTACSQLAKYYISIPPNGEIDCKNARRYLEKLVTLKPEVPEYQELLGICLERQ